jgi:hypothetical protein
MSAAAEQLRDAILRQHLQTIRLTNGEAERIVRLLARTEMELLRRLEERLRAIELPGVPSRSYSRAGAPWGSRRRICRRHRSGR